MDLSPNLLTLVIVVSFGFAIIGGMGGFGTGIILTATLTPILGIKAVVPFLALTGIIINTGRFWFYRRDFDAAPHLSRVRAKRARLQAAASASCLTAYACSDAQAQGPKRSFSGGQGQPYRRLAQRP